MSAEVVVVSTKTTGFRAVYNKQVDQTENVVILKAYEDKGSINLLSVVVLKSLP